MRALLVAAAPAPHAADELVALAAEADIVIAVDGGAALCRAAGVRPSLLLGDFDSASPDDVAFFERQGVEIARFPAEKDASDLELALAAARDRGATAVTVTAAAVRRLDHTLATIAALVHAADLMPALVDFDSRLWVLDPRGRTTLALAGAGATFSAIAFGGDARVSVTGARWPLDRALLTPDSALGLSNRVLAETPAIIEVHEGTVLVLSAAERDIAQAEEA